MILKEKFKRPMGPKSLQVNGMRERRMLRLWEAYQSLKKKIMLYNCHNHASHNIPTWSVETSEKLSTPGELTLPRANTASFISVGPGKSVRRAFWSIDTHLWSQLKKDSWMCTCFATKVETKWWTTADLMSAGSEIDTLPTIMWSVVFRQQLSLAERWKNCVFLFPWVN